MTVFNPLGFHYTMNVGVMVLISVVLFITVSLLTDPPNAVQIAQLTYTKDLAGMGMENQPWYKGYRTHMTLLLILIGYILYVFW